MDQMRKDERRRANKNAKVAAAFLVACLASLPRLTDAEGKYNVLIKPTSNYVYRGYSKSNGDPDVQGDIDYEHPSGFFLGAWISHVDFGDGRFKDHPTMEANPYAGMSLRLMEDWQFEATLAGYLYDAKVFGRSADYGEVTAALHFRDLVTARGAVAHDAYGRGASTLDYEVNLRYPLTATVEIFGSVGYEDANAVFGYRDLYWNLGAAWFLSKHVALDLRYYDAHHVTEAGGEATRSSIELPRIGNPVVFSLSIGF